MAWLQLTDSQWLPFPIIRQTCKKCTPHHRPTH